MDLGTKTANDLLSKDFKVARGACDNLINHKDFCSFEKLVNASEFIFPFIKEKINNNLIKSINEKNYKNLFSFMKLYSCDFEDFIVQGLLKFASQDLTDEIYEIFENGTVDEKIYCASYFSYVNDSIALDLLNRYALCDNDELAQSCARALSCFNDKKLYNEALEIINNSDPNDLLDNIKYFNFLINYGDAEILPILFKYAKNSPLSHCVLPDLLNLVSYSELIDNNDIGTALKIFIEHLSAYPEFLSLSTLENFEIYDFIKYLFELDSKDPILSLAILKTKISFELFQSDEAYKIELNKNEKDYLNKIFNYIESKDDGYYNSHKENLSNCFIDFEPDIVSEALNIISELRINSLDNVIYNFIKTSENETLICESVKTLKNLDKLQNVNRAIVMLKIKNENLRAITLSYFD